MKTGIKKGKIISDADSTGAMMVYKPMTKKQEKELGEWVASRKAKATAKRSKTNSL